jgi:tRNA N6-adenosine threonylcarbamoyltransferase
MLILGIESSCDDTSAAVVADGRQLRSSVVSGQDDIHEKFGGIVPELACRRHVELIDPVVRAALEKAGVTLDDIEGVAATGGPGLIGSLLIGFCFAKALAWTRELPFVKINHLEAHLTAIFLEEPDLQFPFIGLVVSGGHTSLYKVKGFGDYRELGRSRDDAAGEAFDKVAKMLGLGYPGGRVIDDLARQGDPGAIKFPRAMISDPSLDFSFSGLKTSVVTHVKKTGVPESEEGMADLVASFQLAVVDVLVSKTIRAAKKEGVDRIVLSGGVAANSKLRSEMAVVAEKERMSLSLPSPALCTDNAAMVCPAADWYLSRKEVTTLTANASASLRL